MAVGVVGYTRALGRKRVVISDNVGTSPLSETTENPLKKRCIESLVLNTDSERSSLEALPQDVLIRVLFGVEHEDLKQLFHVSKAIREATLIAKQCHFSYSTPTKKSRAFGTRFDFEDLDKLDEIEAPNAPLRRQKSRVVGKKLSDISIALFAYMDEEA